MHWLERIRSRYRALKTPRAVDRLKQVGHFCLVGGLRVDVVDAGVRRIECQATRFEQ